MSYGVGAASEWRDVLHEAAKGVLLLAVLERLHLTRSVAFLEVRPAMWDLPPAPRLTHDAPLAGPAGVRPGQEHIDYLSCQALLFQRPGLSFWGQVQLLFAYKMRVSD